MPVARLDQLLAGIQIALRRAHGQLPKIIVLDCHEWVLSFLSGGFTAYPANVTSFSKKAKNNNILWVREGFLVGR